MLNAVQADATDERALRAIGVAEVDVVVISLGDRREASILAAMIIQDLGVKEIVVKVVSDLHARVLKRLGVSRLVFPEKDMGKRVAERLLAPQIVEHLELSAEYGIEEIIPPAAFVDRSIGELKVRSRFGISVLAIRRRAADGTERMIVNPGGEERILGGDLLIVIGHEANLTKLRE